MKHNLGTLVDTYPARILIKFLSMQTKVLLFVAMLLSILFVGTSNAEAATHYVRAGASGSSNGNDWTNAYTTLPASLVRGDIYYIATGSYGSYTFDDSASGSMVTTIKKATVTDHGTDIGWSDTYGDGQAIFSGIVINTSYILFDGNSSNGSYGFSIPASGLHGINIGSTTSVSNVTVKGVTINMASASGRGIYLSSGSPTKTNILIENVDVNNSENDCITMDATSYLTMDHFVCRDRRNVGGGVHGDAIEIWGANNCTLRYSKINWNGQQLYFAGPAGRTYTGWKVYGNVFYGGASAGKGITIDSTNPTISNIAIYNNTFQGLSVGLSNFGSYITGDARNNLFYNAGIGGWGSVTNSSNTTASSNPFVDIATGNYHLSAAISGDRTIGATYNTEYNADPDGITRATDGVWDRGAHEFVGTSIPRPSAPFNLNIN